MPRPVVCTCCRHYPGTATGGTALLIRPVMSAFPGRVAGSACASTLSRLTQRSLTLRPAHSRCHQFVARLPEGFRHFVTSMPAPVASGWSGCRAGLAPAGKRRLITAHTHSGPTARSEAARRLGPGGSSCASPQRSLADSNTPARSSHAARCQIAEIGSGTRFGQGAPSGHRASRSRRCRNVDRPIGAEA